MVHVRKSRPDHGLGLKTVQVVPSSLGSGKANLEEYDARRIEDVGIHC